MNQCDVLAPDQELPHSNKAGIPSLPHFQPVTQQHQLLRRLNISIGEVVIYRGSLFTVRLTVRVNPHPLTIRVFLRVIF